MNIRKILPYIVGTLTQHDREIVQAGVDFEWSDRCWTHNFYRTLELIFGRKAGIRAEVSVFQHPETKVVTQHFHTIESVIAHTEGLIRAWKPIRFPYKVWVPMMQTPMGMPVPASPYLFAIAYVTGNNIAGGGASTTPQNISVTTSGSNTLMGFASMTLADTSTAPTYNSAASTSASTATTYPGSGRYGARLYYLIAPTTGTNTATFSSSPTGVGIGGFATQYSGCLQVSPLGGTATNTGASVSSITCTVTIASANSYILAYEVDSGSGSGPSYTAGAGTNAVRVPDVTLAGAAFDGGPFATGSQSVTINMLGSVAPTLSAVAGMEIKVAATASGNSGFFAFFN